MSEPRAEIISEYGPNILFGSHGVEIVLRSGRYSRAFSLSVGGNCRGMDVINAAISDLEDELLEQIDSGEPVVLTDPNGDELEFDEHSELEVGQMVVSVCIVAFLPEARP